MEDEPETPPLSSPSIDPIDQKVFRAAITELEKEIIEKEGENLIVPERLTSPDRLIISAKKNLEESGKYRGRGGMVNTRSSELNIRVTPENIGRALRFMDTLIKVIRNRGHEILISDGETNVVISEENIPVICREKLNRVPIKSNYSWQQYDYVASGILTFNATVWFNNIEWKDGREPLEKQVAKIVAKLELKGDELKRRHNAINTYWKQQRAIERKKAEKQKTKEDELERFIMLLKNAKQHSTAEFLRTYINKVESHASKTDALSEEKKKWLEWARKKADWYDPLVSLPDELLDGFDKNNLTPKAKNRWE